MDSIIILGKLPVKDISKLLINLFYNTIDYDQFMSLGSHIAIY